MIPWECRTSFQLFNYKTVVSLLFLCLCILSSHCRPIYYQDESVPVPGSRNNSSMVVRVIVSSSSSSSSSSSGDSEVTKFHENYFPFQSLRESAVTTTRSPSTINPTTYHPDLTLPPISRSVRAKTSLANDDNIFSVFYRAFSEQGDKGEQVSVPMPNRSNLQISFHTQRPSENNVSVNTRVVSVVSQSRSVSASRNEADNSDIFRKVDGNRDSWRTTPKSTPTRGSSDQPKAEALTQSSEFEKSKENWQEKVWGHPEQNWGTPEINWGESMKVQKSSNEPEQVWGDSLKLRSRGGPEPEKVWGEPEKNWEKPEKVWSAPESLWRKQTEKVEDQPPRVFEITPYSNTEEEESQGKFYELGEDEEAEPQELVLKESEVKAKVEEAQLAARSWELPELNSPVPHSLVSGVEMMAESVQVPRTDTQNVHAQTQVHVNIKQRPVAHSKAIESSLDVSERPVKKFGYILDSSDVRKYRVEERTPDGRYIVGEYGVINHDNGSFLRGVRYTADGTINPRLIHETLMKFLAL